MRTEATAEAALPLVLWAPASVPRNVVTVLVLVVAGHGGVGHVVAGLRAQATRLQQGRMLNPCSNLGISHNKRPDLPAVLSKAVAVSSCQPGANLFICEIVIASVAQMPRHPLTWHTIEGYNHWRSCITRRVRQAKKKVKLSLLWLTH